MQSLVAGDGYAGPGARQDLAVRGVPAIGRKKWNDPGWLPGRGSSSNPGSPVISPEPLGALHAASRFFSNRRLPRSTARGHDPMSCRHRTHSDSLSRTGVAAVGTRSQTDEGPERPTGGRPVGRPGTCDASAGRVTAGGDARSHQPGCRALSDHDQLVAHRRGGGVLDGCGEGAAGAVHLTAATDCLREATHGGPVLTELGGNCCHQVRRWGRSKVSRLCGELAHIPKDRRRCPGLTLCSSVNWSLYRS